MYFKYHMYVFRTKSHKSPWICMKLRSCIHNLNVCVRRPANRASHLDAVPPRWTWGWRCTGPWWLWHSGWSWPPAAGRGRQCMPESSPGPHPQTRGLALSPPSLLLRSVHIELDQCYHPDHLAERGRERKKKTVNMTHISLTVYSIQITTKF